MQDKAVNIMHQANTAVRVPASQNDENKRDNMTKRIMILCPVDFTVHEQNYCCSPVTTRRSDPLLSYDTGPWVQKSSISSSCEQQRNQSTSSAPNFHPHLPDPRDVNIDVLVAELPAVDRLIVHLHVLHQLAIERRCLWHLVLRLLHCLPVVCSDLT